MLSVTAAAAAAAAGGEDFVEGDGAAGLDAGGVSEFEGGAGDEVFVEVGGDAFAAAGDVEVERAVGGDCEGVVPGERDHPGFEVVEAPPPVGARGEDAEAEELSLA